MSQGVLLQQRKLAPMNWVRHVDEDEVVLSVGARMLDELRPYEGE